MATLRAALKTTLEADSTLMALLTGGVFDSEDVFREGVDEPEAPRESNGVTIKPFASIRWGGANPTGPVLVDAEAQSVEIYCYQHSGYTTIEAALTRIKALLNRKFITADNRQMAYFAEPQKGPDFAEEALNFAPGKFIRFMVTQVGA